MILKGIAVSSGVAQGTAWVIVAPDLVATPRRTIDATDVEDEIGRLETALGRAEQQLLALETGLRDPIGAGSAAIFGAQALLLRSRSLVDPIVHLIRAERLNVEAALTDVIGRLTGAFEAVADPTLAERAADIRDIGRRVLGALCCEESEPGERIPDGAIVVASELLPSFTARLELQRVRGLITERGARSSHAAILARAQGTPAVAGVADAMTHIKTGDRVIVDGIAGTVLLAPDARVVREYDRVEAELRARKNDLRSLVDLPSVTADGTPIPLYANVNKLADTEAAVLYNADGIGLYRTEFGFAVRTTFPTEDEQHEFLERAAARLHPRRVVFRLLDVGGDKSLPYLPLPATRNPSLARRGVRLLLDHPEILRTQLRAFLRISGAHPISILVPVVGGLEEMRQVRAAVVRVQAELKAEGQAFDPHVPIGAMIEVPSAALMAGAMARECDFFSLGTNDLVQYLLAADREEAHSATDYQPLHPAVLRLIHSLTEAVHAADRTLTICGEMAGNPAYTRLLLGLGLRHFSVAPGQMLEVKQAIRAVRLDEAQALAKRALHLDTTTEIEALLRG